MANHPNATASALTTVLAAAILHYAHRFGWIRLSSEDALIVAGALITAVLFVGKRGIIPTIKAVLHGSSSPPPPTPPAAGV